MVMRLLACLAGALWLSLALDLEWVPTSSCLGSALVLTWLWASLAQSSRSVTRLRRVTKSSEPVAKEHPLFWPFCPRLWRGKGTKIT